MLRASAVAKIHAVVAQRISEVRPWHEPERFGLFLVGINEQTWNSDAATMSIWIRCGQI